MAARPPSFSTPTPTTSLAVVVATVLKPIISPIIHPRDVDTAKNRISMNARL